MVKPAGFGAADLSVVGDEVAQSVGSRRAGGCQAVPMWPPPSAKRVRPVMYPPSGAHEEEGDTTEVFFGVTHPT